MLIRDLESRTGLDRATVRYYEKEGLIAPERKDNGYRIYSTEDCDTLLKIKLLRRLGMNIEQIRMIQQGSAVFSEALSRQIQILSEQIAEQKRAKAVCQAIFNDGSEYRTMDTAHYLKLLDEIKTDEPLDITKDFREDIPRDIHPWRRWFARWLDYALVSAVVQFLIVVVFRVRPLPGNFKNMLLAIFVGFLYVPMEAFLLSKWGTTPGKLAMGIRLENIQGGHLPFWAALRRSWLVLKSGAGFRIPVVDWVMQVYRYCKLTGREWRRFSRYDEVSYPEEMPWDAETEILYTVKAGKKGIVLSVLAVLLAITTVTALDSVKPKHRGSELTIAQFAENYNSYLVMANPDAAQHEKIQSDGTLYPVPNNTIVFVGAQPLKEQCSFKYETEGNVIQKITYSNRWSDIFYLTPIDQQCLTAAITAVMSQDGMSVKDLYDFAAIWDKQTQQPDGRFTYHNVEIEWHIEAVNCTVAGSGVYMSADENAESDLSLYFEIRINGI